MNIPLMDKHVMPMYKHMHFKIKENICIREKKLRILQLCKNIKSEHSLKSWKSENISEIDITGEIIHLLIPAHEPTFL